MILRTRSILGLLFFLVLLCSLADSRRCARHCKHRQNGNYALCRRCDWYATCSNFKMYKRQCPNGLVWNDILKRCDWTSPTCGVDPVDGVWGDWTSYSNCDVTCGDGMMTRTRSCDNPSPRNGGQPCPGGNSETIPCSEQPCASADAGQWGDWSDFSACSALCGGGSRERSRVCVSPDGLCDGYDEQSLRCGEWSCPAADSLPLAGQWSRWTGYSACSVTCGGGEQQKTRLCDNPPPYGGGADCVGRDRATRPCAEWDCPDCSRTCSGSGVLADCAVCMCDGDMVMGRVRSAASPNIPLGGVEIRVGGKELKVETSTNSIGYFTIEGYCLDDLSLTFSKIGFMPVTVDVDQSSGELEVLIHVIELKFSKHPESTGVLSEGDVTLTCAATGAPEPTHYDWFCNDDIIVEGGDDPAQSDTLILSPAKNGTYRCRAVSPKLTKLSNPATVTVSDSTDDSCPQDPLRSLLTLPAGCTVSIDGDDENTVDIGKCKDTACQSLNVSTVENGCCGAAEHEELDVTCNIASNALSFTVQQITRCGCGQCVSEKQVVTIRGQIYLVAFEDNNQVLSQPWKAISFVVNGITHTALPSGEFTIGAERTSDAICLIFSPTATDTYMPHLMTLSLIDGVSSYSVTVKLPPKPAPLTLNTTEENLILSGPSLDESPLVIKVPANSFVDANGVPYQGEIDVFVTFMNPNSSLDLAPGEFTYIDEDGFRRRLITYGVINMLAMTKEGEELHLSGDLQVNIDDAALGMSPENVGDTSTWQIDPETGFWKNPEPLSGDGNSRKKRQLNAPLTSVLNTGGRHYWNLDRTHFAELCEVLVVPYDFFGVEPVVGVQIQVHALVTGDGRAKSRDIRTTDEEGKACAWIECGNNFEIFEASGEYVPTGGHCLPPTFIFQNALDNGITHIYGLAPTAAQIAAASEGPVHLEAADTCEVIVKQQLDFVCMLPPPYYHFQLKAQTPSQAATLDILSGATAHQNFHDGRVCFIRIAFQVVDASRPKLSWVLTSMQQLDDQGDQVVFGVLAATISQLRDGNGTPIPNNYYSCAEVKCPSTTGTGISGPVSPEIIVAPVTSGTPPMACAINGVNEDLPELDVQSSSLDGRVQIKLSTQFNCPNNDCLDNSVLLFNSPYTGGVIAKITAEQQALAQCSAGVGLEVAKLLCN